MLAKILWGLAFVFFVLGLVAPDVVDAMPPNVDWLWFFAVLVVCAASIVDMRNSLRRIADGYGEAIASKEESAAGADHRATAAAAERRRPVVPPLAVPPREHSH
jgi:hypothetical protein